MKSPLLLFLPGLVAGVGLAAAIPACAHAATYEVVGQLTTVIYEDGAVIHSRTNPFKASVEGCKFRVYMEGTGLASPYSEFAALEDYSVSFVKNDVALMNSARSVDQHGFEYWPQPEPGWIPEASLYVNPTVVPQFSTATLPWLAYGSRCYLSEARNGVIQSPVVQDFSKARTKYWLAPAAPAQWRFLQSAPGLLESLVVFRDGKTLGLPPPFTGRTTNCAYEVLQWTNVAGLTVPQQFKLTRYALDLKARAEPHLLLDGVISGLIREVTPRLTVEAFVPTLSTNMQVFDRRFEDEYSENAILYRATEGRILDYEELKKQPRFRAFVR